MYNLRSYDDNHYQKNAAEFLAANSQLLNPSNDFAADDASKLSCLREEVKIIISNYLAVIAAVDGDIGSVKNLYQKVQDQVDTALISEVLKKTNGNQSKAAAVLGLNRGTLRGKIKKLNL